LVQIDGSINRVSEVGRDKGIREDQRKSRQDRRPQAEGSVANAFGDSLGGHVRTHQDGARHPPQGERRNRNKRPNYGIAIKAKEYRPDVDTDPAPAVDGS
jgi:hypothetical protein